MLSSNFIIADEAMCDYAHPVAAPYFRRSFHLDFVPEQAEITICGLGFYELYVNGKEITKGPLAPCVSNPEDVYYYDHYRIAELLNQGENVIGILLGNGYRNCFGGGVWEFDKAPGRGPVTVALYMKVSGMNQQFELETDEEFRVFESPVLWDDLRMGYVYDARKEIPGWNQCGFDDSGWKWAKRGKCPGGIPKLCEVEPIAVTESLEPVGMKYFERLPFAYENQLQDALPLKEAIRDNVYVYDFGVNLAGVTRLEIDGFPGQMITIRHGETNFGDRFSINNLSFYKEWRKALRDDYVEYSQKDTFICKGGLEIFVPKFKYDGFQYAYVEGLTAKQARECKLTALVMNSDVKERAGFECSDETLNRLQKMTRRADLSNLYYIPTDCPHREKNGWTGDMVMSAEHMLLNLTAEHSLREWLFQIRLAQTEEGAMPVIVPTGGWGIGRYQSPTWDSICVELPWQIYRYTGDKEVLQENAKMILKCLHYYEARKNSRGMIETGFGDWMDPFLYPETRAPREFVETAMLREMARKAARLFEIIGHEKERIFAQRMADEIKSTLRMHCVDFQTMTAAGECQSSQAIAIETGLFETNELEGARKRLIEIIHQDGEINTCGMVGLRYIYHALTKAGAANLAYRMITKKSVSCYGYWVAQGATSLWEKFAAIEDEVASLNHHFFGDISSWMIQEIAGLKPNADLNDRCYFEISPCFIEDLDNAKAYVQYPEGKLEVEWNRTDTGINLKIVVPKGVHGRVFIKNQEPKILDYTGLYEFFYENEG